MGAAQSKKRRKERKRKKMLEMGLNPDLDIPRSASVDFLRTHSVSASSCPYCPAMSSQQRSFSGYSLGPEPVSPRRDASPSLWCYERETMAAAGQRTFSELLVRPHHHMHHHHRHHHDCLRGLYQGVNHDDDSSWDTSESCPSCCTSNWCLTVGGHQRTMKEGMERSTMSLNRNLAGKSSCKAKSSDFSELLDVLQKREEREERGVTPTALLSVVSPQELHQACSGQARVLHRNPLADDESAPKETENILSSAISPISVLQGTDAASTSEVTTEESKTTRQNKSVNILEDEATRIGRWEKKKLMAQQLRVLRKHIKEQEASSDQLHSFSYATDKDSETSGNERNPSEPTLTTDSKLSEQQEKIRKDSRDSSSFTVPRRSSRSKFSKLGNYRYLDNHPLLSKLQNEQNNRLESMEKRMKEIRISAMQAAERRKFAEIFPAKEDNSETEKMLQEARETLEKLQEEKRRRNFDQHQTGQEQRHQTENRVQHTLLPTAGAEAGCYKLEQGKDSGDIIPVSILSIEEVTSGSNASACDRAALPVPVQSRKEGKLCDGESKSDWLNEMWPNINLGQPLTWLLLPFLMFPLVLRMVLSFVIGNNNNHNHNHSPASNQNDRDSHQDSECTKCK